MLLCLGSFTYLTLCSGVCTCKHVQTFTFFSYKDHREADFCPFFYAYISKNLLNLSIYHHLTYYRFVLKYKFQHRIAWQFNTYSISEQIIECRRAIRTLNVSLFTRSSILQFFLVLGIKLSNLRIPGRHLYHWAQSLALKFHSNVSHHSLLRLFSWQISKRIFERIKIILLFSSIQQV